ncbi:MAG: hypothetical protein J6W06_08715 [Bacteroidales bacterium]|nr:hypothetical protein [Bacteroidales bacterium]
MDEKYNILISKLDKFIRKYYLNKIVKGFILALAISGLWYLIVVIAEYYGRFSSAFRTALFVSSITLYAIVFVTMILWPLLKLMKIGKRLSYSEASRILGKHFPEVADKLQNTLELNSLLDENSETRDLVYASISQRIEKLSPIPFLSAIKIKKNVKYLVYLVPVVLVFILIISFKPAIVTEGTERIVKYDEHFEMPAPFSFILENDTLQVRQGDDFTVNLRVEGQYVPEHVMINFGGNSFYMEKQSTTTFKYDFKTLNNSFKFYFTAQDVESKDYEVSVMPAPIILDFKINIKPMAYTGLEAIEVKNSGDIEVPVGSNVEWTFGTANLDSLAIVFDSVALPTVKERNEYAVSKRITTGGDYMLFVSNEYFSEMVDIKYHVRVIPDLYPTIVVNEAKDSTNPAIIYFKGAIDDDYGFTRLTFRCFDGENEIQKSPVQFSQRLNSQDFYYAVDFSTIEHTGNRLTYYFEVTDNDGYNGPKSAKSKVMEFNIPSAQDLQDMSDETNTETENKIDEAKKISDDIKKSIDELKRKLVNENLSPYDRSQLMQDIIDKEDQLESLMEQIKDEQSQLQQYKEQFSKSEELLKKQAEINSLMENLMTDEMRQMIEEMKKLMENFNKDEFFKKSEEFKMSVEEMEQNMDNTLELLKRSEVEERVKSIADQMENLAEKEKKLAEETKDKSKSQEQLKKEQSELNEQFDKLKEEYEKTLDKNSDLKEPMPLQDFKNEMNDISNEMQQANENLNENKNNKASDKQKNSSQKMQQLSEKMDSMMAQMEMEENGENMDEIRQLLENVLTFSFDQENIMSGMKPLSYKSPQYKDFVVGQKNLTDNFSLIRDSLNALSARVPGLSSMVSPEVMNIRKELASVMEYLGNSQKYQAQVSQQKVLTSANNLALLLSEVLDQMQQQQMQMQGNSSSSCNKCKNKGQGQPQPNKQMGEMRDMQQQLKNQMQQMLDQMKKNGQQGQNGEQLAKMLMQQEMMQKMLNDMMNGELSPDAAKYLKEANKMIEQNIRDLVNRNVTQQTVNRQEQIITRLLQAENSQNERETEQKRQSHEAKEYKLSNPDKAFEEKESEIRFNELLQVSNLKLRDYYKNKYKEYLKNLKEN